MRNKKYIMLIVIMILVNIHFSGCLNDQDTYYDLSDIALNSADVDDLMSSEDYAAVVEAEEH